MVAASFNATQKPSPEYLGQELLKEIERQRSMLHAAAYTTSHYTPERIFALISAGASLTEQGDEGLTALQAATEAGMTDCVNALLAAGANPLASALQKPSPLWIAVHNGNLSCVEALLKHGAAPDAEGIAMLKNTLIYKRTPILRALLAAGADPNKTDLAGTTALMYAVKYGNEPAVALLLKHGADPFMKDREGLTARDWADSFGYTKISERLERREQALKAAPGTDPVPETEPQETGTVAEPAPKEERPTPAQQAEEFRRLIRARSSRHKPSL